jgi:hypothetical protein
VGLTDFFKSLGSGGARMRVVEHRPWMRLLTVVVFALVALGGLVGGYYFGSAKSGLDRTYVDALEELDDANTAQISELKNKLVDAELARQVDAQAAAQLREDIKQLRDEAAALKEEVTFYKSLMAPSSIERGLQIAEFELSPTDVSNQFIYHLLLTQVEARRDWIQGDLRLEVRGRHRPAGAQEYKEVVLSLTEIAEVEPYPLKFRFRYFQDLSGKLTLPTGFLPEAVVVTAVRRGSRADDLQRAFDWAVRDQA